MKFLLQIEVEAEPSHDVHHAAFALERMQEWLGWARVSYLEELMELEIDRQGIHEVREASKIAYRQELEYLQQARTTIRVVPV